MGHDPAVDLDDPDWAVSVEARPEQAFVFLEHRDGPGGLPVGSQAPLVALVSGGIDSPVAAWLAMKRGSPIVPLYVDLGDYGGHDHRARAEATVADLAGYAPNLDLDLRVAPGGEAVDRLVAEMAQFRMLSLRRFMLAVGEAVASAVGAAGIVTGEAIGQKSSQTAANLRVTSAVTDLPVHRPLLAMDKADITERARAIGTFDDATISAGCNRVAPDQPATAADLERVREVEPDDLVDLAREAAAAASTVSRERLATAR
jgi:thiamine biosynthesis protein ThiI